MRRLGPLSLLALATCFSGDVTRGLPCTHDDACGGGLACVDGVCGGAEPTPTYLAGLSVLFVITDDPESGHLQARVAAAADPFIKVFEDADLDFRVGVISSAMDHPACGPGGDGQLQLASCRDRADDFQNADLGLDLRDEACNLRCPEGLAGDLATPAATTVEAGGPTHPRRWIQSGPIYEQNLTFEDRPPSQFIGCFLPRGVAGCKFEQPLAALVRALERMRDPMDPNYGFVGEGDLLVVMFVGRGPECSYDARAAAIFDPAGDRVFWPPTLTEQPEPSICWNAGAACTNEADGHYFECHPVDLTRGGGPAQNPADAVLLPTQTTADDVTRAVTDLGAELLVGGVLGVEPDFDGRTLHFPVPAPDMPDPFGIGPGCMDKDVVAAPPLRLYAFTAAVNQNATGVPFTSACVQDPSKSLTPFARDLAKRMKMPLPTP